MSKREKTKQEKRQWVLTVVILSFALSVVMSVLTSLFVDSAGLLVALLALIVLISIGVITDVIGTAVTSADEQPFIAMASKRIRGAKQALQLIRKAERVSSLLNDVVGDICGIVSGTTTAVIVVRLQTAFALPESVLLSVAVTALVSGLTIGGKALGKTVALNKSTSVVYWVGRFLHLFHR